MIDDNQFDIFQWANWADAHKKDLLIDLFIFNKNFTPYVLPLKISTIEDQMRSLFLYDMINFVETGAAVGLSVRDYATNDQMENVLLYSELDADAAFKIPADNQVLIAGGKVFAFNPKKFVNLFKQDPSSYAATKQVIDLLMKKFALNLPGGLSFAELADRNKSLTTMLMKLDVEHLPCKERVVDYAEEMDLALMSDNHDGIIIMDNRDAMMFVNILADNYVDSNLTDSRYLVTGKKRIDSDSQMNMNI